MLFSSSSTSSDTAKEYNLAISEDTIYCIVYNVSSNIRRPCTRLLQLSQNTPPRVAEKICNFSLEWQCIHENNDGPCPLIVIALSSNTALTSSFLYAGDSSARSDCYKSLSISFSSLFSSQKYSQNSRK